ncbi:MAG: PAS domain-containing protein [Desulfarculaceae bacterium]|nr:PAS domain-containing protein [Desulfarculaceae bacterium]
MSDETKTKQELLAEVACLRRQLAEARKDFPLVENGAQAVLYNLDAFPQIVNFIKEVFYVKDVALDQYTYVSPAFKDVFGAGPDVILGDQKKYLNLIHPEDRKLWLEAVRIQKEQEIFFNQEYRIVHPNGDVRWVHARSFPVHDDQGKVFRIVGIAEDITEEKETKEKIEKSLASLTQAETIAGLGYFERNWQNGEGYWSDGFFKLLGLEPGQQAPSYGDFLDLVHPDDRENVISHVQGAMRDGRQTDLEFRLVRQGGGIIDVHVIADTKYDDSGRPLLTAGVFLDITSRKQAETALRESEELFRHAFDNASTGVCLVDPQGRLIRSNDRLCEIFGYSRTELEGMSVNDIAHPDDRDLSPAFMKQSLTGEISNALFEKRYVHKEGHIVWGQVSSSLVRDAQGKPQYFVSHITDITARKQAEETLQAREALLNEVGSIAKIGGWEMDLATRQATWTKGTYDIVEIDPGQPVPGPDDHLDYYLPEHRPVVAEAMRALVEQDKPLAFDAQLKTAKGRQVWVRALGRAERVDGKAVKLYGTLQDVTERKKVEQALQESQQQLKGIGDNLPTGMIYQIVREKNGLETFTYVSEGVKELFNCTPEEAMADANYVYSQVLEDDVPNLVKAQEKAVASLSIFDAEMRVKKSGGGFRWIRATSKPTRIGSGRTLWNGVAQDISNVKKLEEERFNLESQLRQSQKMEAIGTLAGGVAHDFNNILSAIIGYTELTLDDLGDAYPVRDNLEQVLKSSWRARNLVSQLLAYSRKQVLEMKTFTLNDLIKQNQSMLSRIIGEDIRLKVSLSPDAGFVRADFNQIEQVMLNLVGNARDAMPEGGRLTIETSNVELDEEYASNHPGAEPGSYVMLAVSDDGPGIAENIREHIFDPFFTTKEVGRGTGLGLATVHGIVKQHLGNIYVYSELGHGSTFKIYLPRTAERPEIITNRGEISNLVGGAETILVAEDENVVREFIVRVLTRLGYRVLEAEHGPAALDLMREADNQVDILLTDVIMPKMNGKELYERLRVEKPGIKVLYISGYTDNVIAHHGVLDDGTAFLQKPLAIATLAKKIRQVLDA